MKILRFTLLVAALVGCTNPVALNQKRMQPPLRLDPPQLQPEFRP